MTQLARLADGAVEQLSVGIWMFLFLTHILRVFHPRVGRHRAIWLVKVTMMVRDGWPYFTVAVYRGAFGAEHVAKTLNASVEEIRIINTPASEEGGAASPSPSVVEDISTPSNSGLLPRAASFGSLA